MNMRFAKVLETLGAGTLVYAIVAACSGGGGGGGGLLDGGTGSGGFGGSPLLDALTDPVSEAKAAPPEIKEAPCDIVDPAAGGNYYYAEFQFPGRSADELAQATALLHYASDAAPGIASGYPWHQGPAFVRDGSLMVSCGYGTTSSIDKVRVFVPAP
jgi:hypothetical protein